MMMPSTSAAAAAGGGRKMVRNENFVRFGKTASTKQQHSLDPDENELKVLVLLYIILSFVCLCVFLNDCK